MVHILKKYLSKILEFKIQKARWSFTGVHSFMNLYDCEGEGYFWKYVKVTMNENAHLFSLEQRVRVSVILARPLPALHPQINHQQAHPPKRLPLLANLLRSLEILIMKEAIYCSLRIQEDCRAASRCSSFSHGRYFYCVSDIWNSVI